MRLAACTVGRTVLRVCKAQESEQRRVEVITNNKVYHKQDILSYDVIRRFTEHGYGFAWFSVGESRKLSCPAVRAQAPNRVVCCPHFTQPHESEALPSAVQYNIYKRVSRSRYFANFNQSLILLSSSHFNPPFARLITFSSSILYLSFHF